MTRFIRWLTQYFHKGRFVLSVYLQQNLSVQGNEPSVGERNMGSSRVPCGLSHAGSRKWETGAPILLNPEEILRLIRG